MNAVQQEQFMRLWSQAQPSVAGYVRTMVPDFHQAEDLIQDIAVLLMRKFGQYDPARKFLPWALTFAKYEVLSSRRDHARSFLSYHSDVLDVVTEAYEQSADEFAAYKGILSRCLEKVKGRSRQMVQMRYWEKLKPKEIARRMGMKSTAVRVALTRTRVSLQRCMKQNPVEDGI